MPEAEKVIETPQEAVEWPTRYVSAEQVSAGDYLIDLGGFHKVTGVKTFEPYNSVQIKTGNVVRSRTNRQAVWVLKQP
jgi:hypothetical protein